METFHLTEPNRLFPFVPTITDDNNLTLKKFKEAICRAGEKLQSEYIIVKLTFPEIPFAKLSSKMGKILFESVAITEQAEALHREFHEQKEESNAG